MRRGASFGSLAIVALIVGAALGQVVPPRWPAPLPPLLFLRIAGPDGMKVTFYRGEPAGVTLNAPCVVGVRPGYTYRFEISNIPGFPGATFSPALEVYGSLALMSQLRNVDFPANLRFSAEDFTKAERGALLKRTIVLEHPDAAEPRSVRPDEAVEIAVRPTCDVIQEVQGRGAPLAVALLGQRTLTAQELTAAAIPGTVLLPGEKSLPAPRVAPWVPWGCYPVVDPLLGAAHASDYVTLFDGGDIGWRAGHDGEGRLRGVDPTDTVAEYVDSQGRRRVVKSNRVALCVPRFIVLRSETGLAANSMAFGPGNATVLVARATLNSRLPFVEHSQPVQLESTANRLKASGTQFTTGTAITGRVNGLEVTSTLQAPNTLDGSCPPPASPTPDRPLRIIKWPDKKGCNVGEVVMFSLQYTNHGSQPITNLAVVDSLTTRFEYIPGSQKVDREARFTTQPNEAGSTMLRWEFPGSLQPGESGLITFQVRVR